MNALLYLFYFIQELWTIPKVTKESSKEISKIEGETCEMPIFDSRGGNSIILARNENKKVEIYCVTDSARIPSGQSGTWHLLKERGQILFSDFNSSI
jgi:hypothetical protein